MSNTEAGLDLTKTGHDTGPLSEASGNTEPLRDEIPALTTSQVESLDTTSQGLQTGSIQPGLLMEQVASGQGIGPHENLTLQETQATAQASAGQEINTSASVAQPSTEQQSQTNTASPEPSVLAEARQDFARAQEAVNAANARVTQLKDQLEQQLRTITAKGEISADALNQQVSPLREQIAQAQREAAEAQKNIVPIKTRFNSLSVEQNRLAKEQSKADRAQSNETARTSEQVKAEIEGYKQRTQAEYNRLSPEAKKQLEEQAKAAIPKEKMSLLTKDEVAEINWTMVVIAFLINPALGVAAFSEEVIRIKKAKRDSEKPQAQASSKPETPTTNAQQETNPSSSSTTSLPVTKEAVPTTA